MAAADAIQVHLAPEAYQAVRRNPADFNQALREYVESSIPDNPSAMSGAITPQGIRGLEGLTLPPATTPLARELKRPSSATLPLIGH